MFLLLCVMFVILLYIFGTHNFNYWKKRGIKYKQPVPFFGNSFRKIFQLISPTDQLAEIYKQFPEERCVGTFEGNFPTLVLRDPELVKEVLITDFHYFFLKGVNMFQTEPLMNNLFTADGDMWKLLRQKLTPAFTTGKLKSMYPLILERAKRMQKIVAEASRKGTEVNVRELMARYTTDVIVSCGYGVDSDVLNQGSSSIFRKIGQRIFHIKLRDIFVAMAKILAPNMTKNWYYFAPEIESAMEFMVKQIIDGKNVKSSPRIDFLDILLDVQRKGKIVGESITKRYVHGIPQNAEIFLDNSLIVAQAFILFAAGYETSSASTSYLLHQLAYHPEAQRKCQEEVDRVVMNHGELTYETIKELVYLKAAFDEALRLYPPIGFYMRQCAKKYKFRDMDLTIDAGVVIFIPVQAIQNDEKYFEEPEKFNPERFLPGNAHSIKNHVFLPFGEGPRTCIGSRLGYLESLVGVATILSKFSVVPTPNSRQRLVTDASTALVQNIKGGIPLAFVSRC